MDSQAVWKIIHSYFEDNPQCLVAHHVESYNDFFKNGIFQIFKEKGPIIINSNFDESIGDYRDQCSIFLGGKSGNRIYFGKPVIFDEGHPHYMFPNEARLRNITYAMTIHYDVEIEFVNILKEGQAPYDVTPDMIGVGGAPHEEYDYKEEHDYNAAMNRSILRDKNLTDEDLERLADLDPNVVGGGPKPAERKKRFKSVEVEMTTGLKAKLNEEKEISVVGNVQKRTKIIEKVYLGKFPIMVQSDFCILNRMPKDVRYNLGECRNDNGGYFIIDGKEKTVVPQEKFGDNMLYIRKFDEDKDNNYLLSAEIKSVSENVSKPIRTLGVRMVAPTTKYTFRNIVVDIPNVRNPVPLFIVFRALGIISDKRIIEMCLLDIDKYSSMLDSFIPSVHDASPITDQYSALMFIAKLTKYGTPSYALEILSDYFLPHVGETNYIQKAYYLGYIVFRLLSVHVGIESPTDRDNFKYKRVELVGSLIYDLFREYYTLQQREIHLLLEKKLYYNKSIYADNLPLLIQQNYKDAFRERTVEIGFKKAFKGNWGAQAHTKRIGIVQDLNRLSFCSAISHLRKTNLPLDTSSKLVGPRVLHASQWGFIDPIDTPDGGNIGLHKHLSITTSISRGYSREPMISWLREYVGMKLVEECGPQMLSTMTRIIVNGLWAGSIATPIETVRKMRLYRRNGLIPTTTSITFEIKLNTIFIYTDAGRLCRPVFYFDEETQKFSFDNKEFIKKVNEGDITWADMVSGFNKKKVQNYKNMIPTIMELHELYDGINSETNPAKLERFIKDKAVIDLIDPAESENALIAISQEELNGNPTQKKKYTHMEIHECLTYGIMCNLAIFLENNPVTRNSFSCGQSKQAVSVYHTNHHVRMDKTAVILNNGQIPLVKSRLLEYINNEENSYGENAIVAIMCYTGYNVEDAVLINEGALKRGLFNTTYYTTYELHEEMNKQNANLVDKQFKNVNDLQGSVSGIMLGYDYSMLDERGLIREGSLVTDKTVLIGMVSNSEKPGVFVDQSKTPKKGQLGIVDKAFITESEEGTRIAKIRIREIRIPNLGDKMASRAGQKGTVGMIMKEPDMPFTKDGLRPDIIINPHAIPTRMTIGQLVECITGKMCAHYGGFGDCTAFNNKGSKIGVIGEHLVNAGFHSSGNEIMYNGMTGEQMESSIFIGPTYYMRLKHMVKDKVNYRAKGPNTALTKQPVAGRANDGGLRIGEMERDVLISHGISDFLRESMMERADDYYMAVCNTTGLMAIYNPSKNLFVSPMADGPLKYTGSMADVKNMSLEHVTRFGRNFSVVRVPYTFKLLMQELQAVNIQMRVITEDNINQMDEMNYSANISKLLQEPGATPERVVEINMNLLKNAAVHNDTPNEYRQINYVPQPNIPLAANAPPTPDYIPESPPYMPVSPPYMPMSPPNAPDSIGYMPPGNDIESPPYDPGYAPESPGYAPESPGYMPNTIVGGASMSETSNYVVGEYVHLRGDTYPQRLWFIKNIGPEYITIEAKDNYGIEDIQNTIKVVSQYDIYRPSDIVYVQPSLVPQHNPTTMMDSYGVQHPVITPQIPTHTPPEVNIKIVNGTDNSISSGGQTVDQPSVVKTNTGSISSAASPIPEITLLRSIGGTNNVNKVSNEEVQPTDNNGEIDFKKGLIIKKV